MSDASPHGPMGVLEALAALPALLRDGVGGRPLLEVGTDGRLRLGVRVTTEKGYAIVPVSLLGPGDLTRFATVRGCHEDAESDVFAFGDRFYSASSEREWHRLPTAGPQERLGLRALSLLGLVRGGFDEPDWPGRDTDVLDGALEVAASSVPCGPGVPDLERLRVRVEDAVRARFAFDGRTALEVVREPMLVVELRVSGRVVTEVDGFYTYGARAAASHLRAGFGLGRAARAETFARALAERCGKGAPRLSGSFVVHEPSCASLDHDPANVEMTAETLVRIVDQAKADLPPGAARAVRSLGVARRHSDPEGRFTPSWKGWRAWTRLWTAVSRALGDTSTVRSGRGTPTWLDRLHAARTVLDLLTFGPDGLPTVRADILHDPELRRLSDAVGAMSELLEDGGEAFGAAWDEARAALDGHGTDRTGDAGSRCRAAAESLFRVAPDAFPSAGAAARWAMSTRPALRASCAVDDPGVDSAAL